MLQHGALLRTRGGKRSPRSLYFFPVMSPSNTRLPADVHIFSTGYTHVGWRGSAGRRRARSPSPGLESCASSPGPGTPAPWSCGWNLQAQQHTQQMLDHLGAQMTTIQHKLSLLAQFHIRTLGICQVVFFFLLLFCCFFPEVYFFFLRLLLLWGTDSIAGQNSAVTQSSYWVKTGILTEATKRIFGGKQNFAFERIWLAKDEHMLLLMFQTSAAS